MGTTVSNIRIIAFEFNGEQHYRPVNFSGKQDEGLLMFEKTKVRDNNKRKYCTENGITLIEIPYWEKGNVLAFLKDKLNKVVHSN